MQQITELFLMIFMGYVIVKARLLKGEDSKVISKIVLYLIIPCVIINAFQVDYTSEKVQGLLLAFAASVMLQVLLLIIVWGAGRLMGLNEVEKASVYYSNAGNLIMPIVTFVLGQEWVLYGCVFMPRRFPCRHLCGQFRDVALWRPYFLHQPQFELLAAAFLLLRASALTPERSFDDGKQT